MADKNGIFEKVDPGTRIYRSRFNRSMRKCIDAFPGKLYPIYCRNALPGDIVKLGLRWNIKSNPSVTPFFTPVKGTVFYFAVPWRQIFGKRWGDPSDTFIQDLLSGGQSEGVGKPPVGDSYQIPLLTNPVFFSDFSSTGEVSTFGVDQKPIKTVSSYSSYVVSLSNCFGYPTFRGFIPGLETIKFAPTVTWHRAYWQIVYSYFIDEDVQADYVDKPIDLVTDRAPQGRLLAHPYSTLWSRDYFMSALKDFLKGVPPALSLGNLSIPAFSMVAGTLSPNSPGYTMAVADVAGSHTLSLDGVPTPDPAPGAYASLKVPVQDYSIPISGAITVDDMRLAFATQRILERANRCGSRYTEFLLSTFGVAPADGTLQRPYFLGGVRFNIVTPEVLQTSESGTTPQGTRSGAGFSVGRQSLRTFRAQEHCTIMALLNIEPEASYCDGLNREATYASRYDFFQPSLQNLSEQVVKCGEIFSDVTNSKASYDPSTGFGYQGAWNELRTSFDEISGNFRYSELDNWHMALRFISEPALNSQFKEIWEYKHDWMRPFANQEMPPFLCDFYHEATWIRPMVKYPVPGLIDHN